MEVNLIIFKKINIDHCLIFFWPLGYPFFCGVYLYSSLGIYSLYIYIFLCIYIPFKINLLEIFVYICATYADYLDTYVAHIYIY